jgi:hypothetical protein
MSGSAKLPDRNAVRRLPGQGEPGRAGPLPPIKRRPELPAFRPAPDPVKDTAPTDNPQEDVKAELDQVSTGFRERMKEEAARAKSATDGSYYFVACFESGEQATAFLTGVGMDAGGDLFVDGRALADRMGIKLPASNLRFNPGRKPDPKLSALVHRLPG